MNEKTSFEKQLENLKKHLEIIDDVFGPKCIGHLRAHYEWNIDYYERNDSEKMANEYREKLNRLSLAIAYMQPGLREFIDAGLNGEA